MSVRKSEPLDGVDLCVCVTAQTDLQMVLLHLLQISVGLLTPLLLHFCTGV